MLSDSDDEWANAYNDDQQQPQHGSEAKPIDNSDSDEWDDAFASETGASHSARFDGIQSAAAFVERGTAPNRTSKTRPFGSFGSSILREACQNIDNNRPALEGIEYARECRRVKLEKERDLKQQILVLQRDHQQQPQPAGTLTAETVSYLKQLGHLSSIYSIGGKVQTDMVQCACASQNKGFMTMDDDLVQHQLNGSLSTISAKALAKQLGQERHPTERTWSIGSFLLQMSCALTTLSGSFLKDGTVGWSSLLIIAVFLL